MRKPLDNESQVRMINFDYKNPHLPKIIKLLDEYDVEEGFRAQCELLFNKYSDNPAPSSSTHHSNILWGNWYHTYIVIREALLLNAKYPKPYPAETIIKVGLGHDLSKFEEAPHEAALKSRNPNKGKIPTKFWEYDNLDIYEGHEDSSIEYARQFFSLSREERNAIRYHMSTYSRDHDIHLDWKREIMTDLCKILSISDLIASQLIEVTYYLDYDRLESSTDVPINKEEEETEDTSTEEEGKTFDYKLVEV